jgi:hypothetical protein
MNTLGRRPSRRIHGAILLAALLAAAAALVATAGCGEEEDSCNFFCSNEAKACASTTDGRTGCARTLGLLECSPSGCCNYCCDP